MGALLDTHTLFWLVTEASPLAEPALIAIADAQAVDRLYVSPATAWELGVIARKPPHQDRPDLGQLTPRVWFREAVRATGARVAPIKLKIALEAAEVVTRTGHKDPGDCFLIATARVLRVPLITRDAAILQIARDHGAYLDVVAC